MHASGVPGIPHVVVVGGGVSGLAAAWRVRRHAGRPVDVTVVDTTTRPGGKLRTTPLPGGPAGFGVDEGAEAIRMSAGMGDLLTDLGLAGAVAAPVRARPLLWIDGRLRPLPGRTLMGIPTDPEAVRDTGVLGPESLVLLESEARVEDEGSGRSGLLARGGDVAVGTIVASRLGAEVVERLVGPLLAGVYAGDPYALSLRATLPALADRLEVETSLVRAARQVLGAGSPPGVGTGVGGGGGPGVGGGVGEGTGLAATDGAAFVTLLGGMEQLAVALLARSGARFVGGAPVRALTRTPEGWEVLIGSAAERGPAQRLRADAIVLAVPAAPAARLLAPLAPAAAEILAQVGAASVGVVTLAYRDLDPDDLPDASGILVPQGSGTDVKAVTFTTRKWPYGHGHGLPDGVAVLRASVGRAGDVAALQRSDGVIAARVAGDIARLTGLGAAPFARRVSRWGGALPQYAPGHRERVEALQAYVGELPGVAVAGASVSGVGIPTCIASGLAAADRVLGVRGP